MFCDKRSTDADSCVYSYLKQNHKTCLLFHSSSDMIKLIRHLTY